ncbi:MAG: DUF1599 domain-containing protein [Patescibacteria group bacterium]|nr:DUF1599 domain-containing protein [Patescibacteria group bacterium]
MNKMLSDYDTIIMMAHRIFKKKSHDYGVNWRVYRPISVLDQLYIKAKRIRTITERGTQKINGVGDDIPNEFIGIVNYGAMGIIQFTKGAVTSIDIEIDEAINLYEKSLYFAQKDMQCNIDNSISMLEIMNPESLNDLILQNILILKRMNENRQLGDVAVKKLIEIINYAIFASIILKSK